jgi:hypothetical protein
MLDYYHKEWWLFLPLRIHLVLGLLPLAEHTDGIVCATRFTVIGTITLDLGQPHFMRRLVKQTYPGLLQSTSVASLADPLADLAV